MLTHLRRAFPRLLLPLLVLLLALAGCSSGALTTNQARASTAPASAATSAPTSTPTAIPAASPTATAPVPTSTSTPRSAPPSPTSAPPAATPAAAAGGATPATAAEQALMDVVQRANDAQQRAFAAQDPTPMQATATAAYYAELVQTNQDLAAGGVTAIALVTLEWGPIVQQGATDAQVTTFETWRTTYSAGSTDQARDRNVYALVHEGGAWKIQSDNHPDASASQPGQGAPGGAGTAPLPATPLGPGQSSNWAGYAASGGNFTAVSGTWTVPQVAATSTAGADATWVGIGGERSHDLIQAGTQATVAGGRVRYEAWVELLPQAAQTVPLVVGPGDRVTVAIGEQAVGTWLIVIQNQTTGQHYQVTETYASTHSSAEWIEEAPSSGRRVVPLDDFGTIQFAAAGATMDGRQVTIAQANGSAITLVDRRGQALATPSALGTDGASFSVIGAAAPLPATPTPPGGRTLPPTTAGTPLARRGD